MSDGGSNGIGGAPGEKGKISFVWCKDFDNFLGLIACHCRIGDWKMEHWKVGASGSFSSLL